MDALSSQATVSGYLAVITAAEELPRFFPMLMTAAGTIRPAQVLVLGAGVAGLQAIGTARRLGAVVTPSTSARPSRSRSSRSARSSSRSRGSATRRPPAATPASSPTRSRSASARRLGQPGPHREHAEGDPVSARGDADAERVGGVRAALAHHGGNPAAAPVGIVTPV
jgi:NAD(P) transhydrogenase subunit alpha